jgi:DNA-binding transcriptional ArsR family regulator
MDQDRIVLDKKAFGALAVDSRVKLLKALSVRRKMLTELSDELKLSPPATKEHLDMLMEAGLIEKFDEGHKWKYYALTRKGESIITPDREIKVWVILGISIIGLLVSFLLMFNALPMMQAPQVYAGTASVPAAQPVPAASQASAPTAQAEPGLETTSMAVTNSTAEVPPMNNASAQVVPQSAAPFAVNPPFSLYMAFSTLCALVAVVCALYLIIDRIRD